MQREGSWPWPRQILPPADPAPRPCGQWSDDDAWEALSFPFPQCSPTRRHKLFNYSTVGQQHCNAQNHHKSTEACWVTAHCSRTLTRLTTRFSSSALAASTASWRPMMVIVDWSASSTAGNITRAPVASRSFIILAPRLPIRKRWYSGLTLISAVWPVSCCYKKNQVRVEIEKQT